MIKSSAANAPRNIEAGGDEDFYELAAIDVGKKLQNPDRLSYLKLKMEGLDESGFDTGILNSGRQNFQSGVVEIIREKTPFKTSYLLPYSDHPAETMPYTQPE